MKIGRRCDVEVGDYANILFISATAIKGYIIISKNRNVHLAEYSSYVLCRAIV